LYSSISTRNELAAKRRIDHLETVLAQYLPADRSSPIADLGCGYGAALKALSNLGYRDICGIDASPLQVEFAKTTLGISDIHVGEAFDWLNRSNRHFEVVLAIDLLEHLELEQLIKMLQSIQRVLTPTGSLIVQVPNAMAPLNPHSSGDITHVRSFTVQSLAQVFVMANLQPVRFAESPTPTQTIAGRIRKVAWRLGFRPVIKLLALGLHGSSCADELYSSNIIAVAKRAPE
jgi:2-polyprenyl-3-methyl-5-hydroxy-6-metoxy-1,4-benzoquinol methylase